MLLHQVIVYSILKYLFSEFCAAALYACIKAVHSNYFICALNKVYKLFVIKNHNTNFLPCQLKYFVKNAEDLLIYFRFGTCAHFFA